MIKINDVDIDRYYYNKCDQSEILTGDRDLAKSRSIKKYSSSLIHIDKYLADKDHLYPLRHFKMFDQSFISYVSAL